MRKYLICLFLLALIPYLSAQEISKEERNRINEVLEKRAVYEAQDLAQLIMNGDLALLDSMSDVMRIAELNESQLRILRNTLFARYGYSFKSKDLQEHFSRFEWYSPKSENFDSQLSEKDKRTIELIRKFENIDTETKADISKNDLTGVWHISPHVAAGFHDVYQFYSDGSFTFNYSQMQELPEDLSFSGKYEIRGNALFLFAETKDTLDHSDEIEWTGGWGYIWKDSHRETSSFTRQYRLPIGGPVRRAGEMYKRADDMMKQMFIIEIGGDIYFKYSDNPDDYS